MDNFFKVAGIICRRFEKFHNVKCLGLHLNNFCTGYQRCSYNNPQQKKQYEKNAEQKQLKLRKVLEAVAIKSCKLVMNLIVAGIKSIEFWTKTLATFSSRNDTYTYPGLIPDCHSLLLLFFLILSDTSMFQLIAIIGKSRYQLP